MTHLNYFSYPSRLAIMVVAAFLVAGLSIVFRYSWCASAKKSLQQRKLPNIKFFSYFLLLMVIVTWILYDVFTTINYYLYAHQGLTITADVFLNITFCAHSSLLFLLNAFQSSIMSQLLATGANFMRGFEFKLYVIYSLVSFCLYPGAQWALYFKYVELLLF